MSPFSDVVDAADQLSVDEQNTLIEILQHRISDRERQRLARDIQEARSEFAQGKSTPASAGDIMREVRQ